MHNVPAYQQTKVRDRLWEIADYYSDENNIQENMSEAYIFTFV